MHEVGDREEATEVSSVLLMDVLGWGIGAGVGRQQHRHRASHRPEPDDGTHRAFTIALCTALTLLSIARRLPSGRS